METLPPVTHEMCMLAARMSDESSLCSRKHSSQQQQQQWPGTCAHSPSLSHGLAGAQVQGEGQLQAGCAGALTAGPIIATVASNPAGRQGSVQQHESGKCSAPLAPAPAWPPSHHWASPCWWWGARALT
jgi:hypothetical protein